jgi:4-amino-4-deoxy-L-arabinose transferase-like glycosyltransferase
MKSTISKSFSVYNSWFERYGKPFKIICFVALLFAYLYDLGYIQLNIEDDEARRALVTAEMMISKNYLTPTINGEVYLNKPPLYNWILIGYFKLFGNYSMFVFRLQVIIALFLTGLLSYHFTKKYTNDVIAFFTAFAYMTNGRILIYDSLFGYIDITFALTAYANIIFIFYLGEKKKYYSLFLVSYFTCALGFLLKGLPALAFQELTLIAYFVSNRNIKRLFSLSHIAGGLFFLMILSAYYVPYFYYNHYSPLVLFNNIYNESAKRTFLEFGIWPTIKHVAFFPFEMLYHFLPWTLFVIALFKKDTWTHIKKNRFICFLVFAFLVNIPLYWFSVEVNPRYIFMFVPLLYAVLFYCYFENEELRNSWQEKIINSITIYAAMVMVLGSLAIALIPVEFKTRSIYSKVELLIAGFLLCSFFVIKSEAKLYFFLVAFILARIGFNWFILEERGERFVQAKAWCNKICEITKGKKLYILDSADTNNFDGMSFHISINRNQILRIHKGTETDAFYIADEKQVKSRACLQYFHFINYPYHNSLYLVKFKE